MEITASKEELAKGINVVNKAVSKSTTNAILGCILFEVANGKVKLTANDTELAITTSINADIKDNGVTAIDARMLTDLVKKFPDGDVSIKTDTSSATIKCGKAKANIPVKDGAAFPAIPVIEKENPIIISQYSLREIIRQTSFAVADNASNKVMNGELFDISGNKLRVVALDGHRVAIRSILLKGDFGSQKVIIPAKTLNEITKILTGDIEDNTEIYITKNRIIFEFDGITVLTRLIEGDYFNTDAITNLDFTTKVMANRSDLLESIDRSTLFIGAQDKKPIVVNITDNKLEWSVNTTTGGMTDNIDAEVSGGGMEIGFNPRLLMDALRVIEDENVALNFVNPKSPMAIKDDSGSYMYIVLPVNFAQQ